MEHVERKILLNPGPATTTDRVKLAQVVPDICPREREFEELMGVMREDLVRIVHGDPRKYAAVLFCGSGTLNMDVCLNSLLPAGKQILIINNGAYSARAVEICQFYGLPYKELSFPVDQRPDLEQLAQTLDRKPEVALVYTTHHETGTGLLNPIREMGELVHRWGKLFVVDTTSSYAMIPIDLERDHIDVCMASAQKGLMAMAGLSFVIGSRAAIEASASYPKRSYYCNLFLQYDYFERCGQMHFTPPVQTIYAARQALREYFAEGEAEKWARHSRTFAAIRKGAEELGFRCVIRPEWQSGLVAALYDPDDPNWYFTRIHDECYRHGYTIYPGKLAGNNSFRLCALGAIDVPDIEAFFVVFRQALRHAGVTVPVIYGEARDVQQL